MIILLICQLSTNFKIGYADSASEAEKSIFETIEKILETLNIDEVEKVFYEIGYNSENIFEKIKELITGVSTENGEAFLSGIKTLAISEFNSMISPMISIIGVILLLAVIDAIKPDILGHGTIEICAFIGNIVIITLVIGVFITLFNTAKNTVNLMTKEIEAIFPLILTLMTVSGGKASVGIFKPSVALICNTISTVFSNILFPIVMLIMIFGAVNAFSSTLKLDRMLDFFKSVYKWIIGITCVFFCFFVSAQGIAASVYDNVSLKAIKYAVGNSVPLINSLLNNGFDIVIASCILIKNALGTLTLIGIVYIIMIPFLRLVIFALILRFVAAVSQSVSNEGTIKFITCAADCGSYLATTCVTVAIAYMLIILIVMCSMGVSL